MTWDQRSQDVIQINELCGDEPIKIVNGYIFQQKKGKHGQERKELTLWADFSMEMLQNGCLVNQMPVRIPTSQYTFFGFNTQHQSLTPSSSQCKPCEAEVMSQGTELLSPTWRPGVCLWLLLLAQTTHGFSGNLDGRSHK